MHLAKVGVDIGVDVGKGAQNAVGIYLSGVGAIVGWGWLCFGGEGGGAGKRAVNSTTDQRATLVGALESFMSEV